MSREDEQSDDHFQQTQQRQEEEAPAPAAGAGERASQNQEVRTQQIPEDVLILKHEDTDMIMNPPLVPATLLLTEVVADESTTVAAGASLRESITTVVAVAHSGGGSDPDIGQTAVAVAEYERDDDDGGGEEPSIATTNTMTTNTSTTVAADSRTRTLSSQRSSILSTTSLENQEVRADQDDCNDENNQANTTERRQQLQQEQQHDSLTETPPPIASPPSQRLQPTRLPETVQQVHFDMSYEDPAQLESVSSLSPTTVKLSTHWYLSPLAWALACFVVGVLAMLVLGWIIFERQDELVPIPGVPSMPPAVNETTYAAPTVGDTTKSATPSSAPSCSGLYEEVWATPVPHSGSMRLALSQDGMTMVVAHYDYKTEMNWLQTFDLQLSQTFQQPDGYHIGDMQVSGDGSTLVLGLSTVLDQLGESVVGGALLVLRRNETQSWDLHQEIITGGGQYGQVSRVAVSYNGTTVAFMKAALTNRSIQVYQESTAHRNEFVARGNEFSLPYLEASSNLVLSGDGTKLFVATIDGTVTAMELGSHSDWQIIGDVISLPDTMTSSTPTVATMFDGYLLVVSSNVNVPVRVYEFHPEDDVWLHFDELDITRTDRDEQFMAVSGDGRNIVVCEVTEVTAAARWYHRTGNVFSSVQDFPLKPSPIVNSGGGSTSIREMVLDTDGEQLVVVFADDQVAGYRKDCFSSQGGTLNEMKPNNNKLP